MATMENPLDRNGVAFKIKQNAVVSKPQPITEIDLAQFLHAAG
jgi:hypothetical protein